MNWTQLANKYGVEGRNRGQIIKEFAVENGIDTIKLDGRQPGE